MQARLRSKTCAQNYTFGVFSINITFSEYERAEMNGWLIYIGLKKDLAAINKKCKRNF